MYKYVLVILALALSSFNVDKAIVDSNLTFEEAIKGTKAPADVIASLTLVDVHYFSVDGKLHKGQLVVNKSVAEDVKKIFELIKSTKFPVNKVIPIVKYDWSDDASMEDNNTSAFNYRFISGTTRLSNHALGKAVDINPFFNPVVYPDGHTVPAKAHYNAKKNGTFSAEHAIVKEFKKLGWRWGGDFTSYKDNHHFDK